ncbi:lipoprotein [soil metagenome]
MRMKRFCYPARLGAVLVTVLLLGACANASSGPSSGSGSGSSPKHTSKPAAAGPLKKKHSTPKKAVKPQAPAPVESNPPGDIPDSTAFVPYRSSQGHFRLRVPEGWSRRPAGSSVTFTSKLNSVTVEWGTTPPAPSLKRAKSRDVRSLEQTVAAFQLGSIKKVSLPAGKTVLITYQANSKANAVTGKQYRLEILRFQFFRHGNEADLVLSSPVGSDNVDPWRIISESLRWS